MLKVFRVLLVQDLQEALVLKAYKAHKVIKAMMVQIQLWLVLKEFKVLRVVRVLLVQIQM